MISNNLKMVEISRWNKACGSRKNETVNDFLAKLRRDYHLNDEEQFHVFTDQNRKTELIPQKTPISKYNLKHGDMLYVNYGSVVDANLNKTGFLNSKSIKATSDKKSSIEEVKPDINCLKEDDIDTILWQQDGKITRGQDAKYCHHPKNSKCIHCTPVEPYDEEYLKNHDPPIKHMSFHAHLRKLMSGTDKGKLAVLDVGCCRIKAGCTEHKPWPKGICTKCQPSAITLQRQAYRHVDNIMFENASMVDRFLDFWRRTGYQRVAYLYGHYLVHKDVPLGIKAVVCALYEPPQVNTANSVKFLEDPMESTVDWVADQLGLKRVGWIFTDLAVEKKVVNGKDADTNTGLVKWLRNKDTYLLSAAECILAAHLQNKYPNVCSAAPLNVYGSKFVTVVVTGDQNKAIHFEGYQVTQQCMALVRDNCLVPTLDVPELGYVRESTNDKYVPDVFYKAKDTYNNEIIHVARPLPVEYLIVDIPASCPMEPVYTFSPTDPSKEAFPIENRVNYLDGNQTFYTFAHYIKQYGERELFEALNDFHVLLYLTNMELLPMRDSMGPLLEAIKTKNLDLFQRWCLSDNWQTLQKLIEMEAPPPLQKHVSNAYDSSRPPPRHLFGLGPTTTQGSQSTFHEEFHFSSHGGTTTPRVTTNPVNTSSSSIRDEEIVEIPTTVNWTCEHCTFVNERCTQECEVCGLPPPPPQPPTSSSSSLNP